MADPRQQFQQTAEAAKEATTAVNNFGKSGASSMVTIVALASQFKDILANIASNPLLSGASIRQLGFMWKEHMVNNMLKWGNLTDIEKQKLYKISQELSTIINKYGAVGGAAAGAFFKLARAAEEYEDVLVRVHHLTTGPDSIFESKRIAREVMVGGFREGAKYGKEFSQEYIRTYEDMYGYLNKLGSKYTEEQKKNIARNITALSEFRLGPGHSLWGEAIQPMMEEYNMSIEETVDSIEKLYHMYSIAGYGAGTFQQRLSDLLPLAFQYYELSLKSPKESLAGIFNFASYTQKDLSTKQSNELLKAILPIYHKTEGLTLRSALAKILYGDVKRESEISNLQPYEIARLYSMLIDKGMKEGKIGNIVLPDNETHRFKAITNILKIDPFYAELFQKINTNKKFEYSLNNAFSKEGKIIFDATKRLEDQYPELEKALKDKDTILSKITQKIREVSTNLGIDIDKNISYGGGALTLLATLLAMRGKLKPALAIEAIKEILSGGTGSNQGQSIKYEYSEEGSNSGGGSSFVNDVKDLGFYYLMNKAVGKGGRGKGFFGKNWGKFKRGFGKWGPTVGRGVAIAGMLPSEINNIVNMASSDTSETEKWLNGLNLLTTNAAFLLSFWNPYATALTIGSELAIPVGKWAGDFAWKALHGPRKGLDVSEAIKSWENATDIDPEIRRQKIEELNQLKKEYDLKSRVNDSGQLGEGNMRMNLTIIFKNGDGEITDTKYFPDVVNRQVLEAFLKENPIK